ncbi:MAG TPA: hypothetical protein VN238_08275 [Solirubrobacteraceae bacterium]|nr:hypothetical protein [Solirubrobacteraceae bacterium]
MTKLGDRYIEANNLSEGWLDAVRLVRHVDGQKVVHLMVRISDPAAEVQEIRAGAQGLIDAWNARKSEKQSLWDIESVRNTIFPAAWARKNPQPADLVKYYTDRYDKQGLLGFKENGRGTYFGRIVAYPRTDDVAADQLSDTVRKLQAEKKSRGPKSSRYEINIFNERLDRNPMSFPCLAHISVHLHEGRVHMQAVYRNEYPRRARVWQLSRPGRAAGVYRTGR